MAFLKRWIKKVKGNRTRIAAFLIGALGIVEVNAHQVIPQEAQGFVLMAIALVMYGLRQITTTPPGKGE